MEGQSRKSSGGLRITLVAAAVLAFVSVTACIAIGGVRLWRATTQSRQVVPSPVPPPQVTLTPAAAWLVPLPTLAPAASGWRDYQGITGRFTLRHPDTWTIVDEAEWSITFDMGDYTRARFSVGSPACDEDHTSNPGDTLNCLVSTVREYGVKEGQTFRLISKDLWEDADWRGYLVEASITTQATASEQYCAWVTIPVQSGTSLVASLGKSGADDVSAGEWRAFIETLKSMRPPRADQ